MANYEWTKEQTLAITEKGSDILVSAAAGSGKTAVLTERIIRQLIDVNAPVDITDFLIVTFTVSATNELHEKLSNALKKTYRENKYISRLKKQILNLPSAKILTIDSFCKYIVGECAKDLDIPADFKLGEENEIASLTKEVLEDTLDFYFDGGTGEIFFDTSYLPKNIQKGFLPIVEAFSTQKSFDPLYETLSDLRDKYAKYPEPIDRFKTSISQYDVMLRDRYINNNMDFFGTELGKSVSSDVQSIAKVALNYFEEASAAIAPFPEMCAKYSPIIENDIDCARNVIIHNGADKIKSLSEYKPIRLTVYKSTTPNEAVAQEKFKLLRGEGKKILTTLADKYPIWDEETLYQQTANAFSIANELLSFTDTFNKRLWDAKIEKKIFSFEDVAHLAYKALVKEGSYDSITRDFERTDYAVELGEKFHEVLIDEYQDVNELQDAIFRAVSNGHNRFMVGDLKQSIYKFRGATPEIFDEYRHTFSDVSSTDGSPRIIALQNNFRSDTSVVDFVNDLFKSIMNYERNDVYTDIDFLKYSKSEDLSLETEISLFNDKIEDENEDGSDAELEYVANKVIDYTSCANSFKFKDICILARTHKSLKMMQNVFSSRGIPSDYTPSENFFGSWEIQTAISLLKACDNPSDDVFFLSAITSPCFAFTPHDLLTVRKEHKYGDIYFAVKEYSESGYDEQLKSKCTKVITKLMDWKKSAGVMSSEDLLWKIYQDTHLFSYLKKLNNSNERKENLIAFYDIAVNFESNELKGLTKFIAYCDELISSTTRIKKSGAEENCVHLMTVHESKGLEFPICFYIESNTQFNRSDEKKKIVVSDKYGPTFAVPTGNLGGKVSTYAEKAAISETRSGSVDEELRLLYVALTRARNKLIITGEVNLDKIKDYIELANSSELAFTHSIKSASTMFKIIACGLYGNNAFMSALNAYNGSSLSLTEGKLTVNLYTSFSEELKYNEVKTAESDLSIKLCKEDVKYAMQEYGDKLRIETPYKISVSNIREGLLDEGAVATQSSAKKFPDFMSLEADNISAFTGTSMHVFMQFCDFNNCVIKGTEAEAERLVREKFISEEQSKVLNHRSLSEFFSSKTFKNIIDSKRIEREKRYTLLLPSSEFYTDEARKKYLKEIDAKTLIQGVIDCYYVNSDDTVTLIDFKTDNVGAKDGEKILRERHSNQMLLYKDAIETIEGLKVSKVIIYSFCLSREIEIN